MTCDPHLLLRVTFLSGVPPAAARPFFDYLEENSKLLTIPNVRFSVLALGDKGYPHFCRAGKTIDSMLEGTVAHRNYFLSHCFSQRNGRKEN